MTDPWHVRASQQVQQWNIQREKDYRNAAAYASMSGSPPSRGARTLISLNGWVGCAALLGFCFGMFGGHEGGFGGMMLAGAIGAAGSAAFAFGVLFAFRGLFFLLALMLLRIKNLIGGVTGLGNAQSGGAFGAVTRSAFKGGFIGGLAGLGIALFLNEPLVEPMARVGAIGAGIAAFIRILAIARGSEKNL